MSGLRCHGFTLIEAIAVIAIMGVVAAMTAIFIRQPVEAYIDASRRAVLTDIADTALRRIARDLHAALPNSVRITAAGGVTYLEFLQTVGGGRYRAARDSAGNGNPLDFTAPDTAFDVIGPVPPAAAGDRIVVYNLGPGSAESDAYAGGNSAAFAGISASTISIVATQFPFSSPGRRFQVVQYPVTYACDPASGALRRYWGYAIGPVQPAPPATANVALLATHVAACGFSYASAAGSRNGIVSLRLQLTRAGETVSLFEQVHIINVP